MAGDSTWLASPPTNSFNNGANWIEGVVPTGTAFFGASNTTTISIAAPTILNTFRVTRAAPAYTFNVTSDLILQDVVYDPDMYVPGASATFNVTGTTFTVTGQSLGRSVINFGNGAFGDLDISMSPDTQIVAGSGGIVTFHDSATIWSLGGSGNVDLQMAAGGSLTVAHSMVFGGVISGPGALHVAQGGTLSGNNTYTGGTIVEAGILQLGDGGTSGSVEGGITVNASSVLSLNRSDVVTFGNAVSGTGSLWQIGTGTTILAGVNTYAKGTMITAGTLKLANAASLPTTCWLAINGGVFDLNGNNQSVGVLVGDGGEILLNGGTLTTDFSSNSTSVPGSLPDGFVYTAISGSGGLVKRGTGYLNLYNNNTFSGGLTVEGGRIFFTSESALGTGSITLNGGILEWNSPENIDLSSRLAPLGPNGGVIFNISDATFATALSGTGRFTKLGEGTLTLANANTYGGGTTLFFGTLKISGDAALGNAAGGLEFGGTPPPGSGYAAYYGATLQTTTSFSSFRAVTLGSGGNSTFNTDAGTTLTWNGAITGLGAFAKTGAGTMILNGNETYSGGTTIMAGTLQLGGGASLSSLGALDVTGGTFDLNGSTQAVAGLSGGGTVLLGTGTLTVDSSVSTAFGGSISGTGALVKEGTGRLILWGANTYTGGTTIAAGSELQIGASGTSGSVAGDIADYGTLFLSRSDTLIIGGEISGTGAVRQMGTGTTMLTGTNTYTGGTTVSGGTLKLGAGASLASGGSLILSSGTFSGATFDMGASTLILGSLSGSGGTLMLGGGTLANPTGLTLGPNLLVGGFGTVHGTVDGAGRLIAVGGLLEFTDAIDGTSASDIRVGQAAGSVLKFDSTVGSNALHPVVTFNGGTSLLDLSSTALPSFHGVLSEFAPGEGIKITNAASATLDVSGTVLTVFDAVHSSLGTLAFDTSYRGDSFVVMNGILSVLNGTTIIGGDGDDILEGGPDADYLYGQGGDDMLIGHAAGLAGTNQLWGGTGIDTASYVDTAGTVYADLTALAGYVDGTLVDQMNSIENLTGGTGTNTLVGDGGDNVLRGGAGNDYLYGQGGNDTLIGGAAPGSTNQLWGGTGIDTASYGGTAGMVYADLTAQAGYVGGVLADEMNSIENLSGGSNADTLVGDGGANRLTGVGGADALWGKGGADVFIYTAYTDSNLVSGYDSIADFVSGTSKLDLSAFATDAAHVLIQSDVQSTSLYLEQNPGSFNASTDLVISFVGTSAIAMGDIQF